MSKINYRKIYEEYYGPIPKDENGRTYEIHHIDGNHNNNAFTNLKAVTIEEHYKIHYEQEDWAACLMISERMKISPEEKAIIASRYQCRRVLEGTHHFLGGELQRKRVKEGTHNLLGGELQRKRVKEGTHHFLGGDVGRRITRKRLLEGTHHWQTEKHAKKSRDRQIDNIQNKKHNFQKTYICDCGCNKSYNAGNYKQHKMKKLKSLTNV